MAVIISSVTENIVDEILSISDDLPVISIIDEKGEYILASKSKESFKKCLDYRGRRLNMVESWLLYPLVWQVN
jgi:hypothetical protein